MVKQNEHSPGRGGSIITMSSVNAVMAIPTCAGYNASKGGISNLTRCRISSWRSVAIAGLQAARIRSLNRVYFVMQLQCSGELSF